MLETLFELEKKLVEIHHPVTKFFQPGLDETELLTFFNKLRLLIPTELLQLYKWHNGVSGLFDEPLGALELLPLGIFFPFSTAFEEYEQYKSRYGMHLWPIMGSGDSDNYLINLSHDKKHNGKIYFASVPLREKPHIKFPSLPIMIEIILECYREEAYFIEEDNLLSIREDVEGRVWERYNVRS